MRKFRRRKRGEMIAMVLTSVFVLGALTVTGIYIKNRNTAQGQDGYYIDFDALEAEMNEKLNEAELSDDLDYTGETEEFDYSKQNTEAVQSGSIEKENGNVVNEVVDTPILEDVIVDNTQETTPATTDNALPGESIITSVPTLGFSEEESLTWPIVGSIIVNYSMDQTVYFETLDQYKYSPAMVLAATEGELVTAATDAVITKIYEDNELGNVVEMDLGDGYRLLYGQLHDIEVGVGEYVTVGQLIDHAGTPTKYYSAEGCNVYVKLTKDDKPVNPMDYLE